MAHGVDVLELAYSVMLRLGETNFIVDKGAIVGRLLMLQAHTCVAT